MGDTFKTKEELARLSHEHLYRLFVHIRSVISSIYYYAGNRCCEICHEYIGDNWARDVGKPAKKYEDYLEEIRSELRRRPYRKFNKTVKLQIQRLKLADLKGNRRRRL